MITAIKRRKCHQSTTIITEISSFDHAVYSSNGLHCGLAVWVSGRIDKVAEQVGVREHIGREHSGREHSGTIGVGLVEISNIFAKLVDFFLLMNQYHFDRV